MMLTLIKENRLAKDLDQGHDDEQDNVSQDGNDDDRSRRVS